MVDDINQESIGVRLTPDTKADLKIILAKRQQVQPGFNITDAVREALRLLANKIKREEK